MKEIVSFINFNGDCRQAVEFYKKCFAAELFLMPYGEAAGDPAWAAKEVKDRIMHSALMKGSRTVLMAADIMPGTAFHPGSNFSVAIQCENLAEIESLFAALSENGAIEMPLQETFWASSFGMLTDQFGIRWLLNLGKPAAG